MDSGQDPTPSTSKTVDFALRKPHSSYIDSSSFMPKEDLSFYEHKQKNCKHSHSNHPNCRLNLECKVETSAIEDLDPSSHDRHDPSGNEVKELYTKAYNSNSNEKEFLTSNYPSFVVDFDEKAIEEHLKDVLNRWTIRAKTSLLAQ